MRLIEAWLDLDGLPLPEIETRFEALKDLALEKISEGDYDRHLWALIGELALELRGEEVFLRYENS